MQRQPTQPDAHASAHPHHAELVNPDGSWKYTNALAKESSPYLLQHAHNPVDWHAWGPEAFELARKTNKPIFLSIGYSTCYWCHVMERQSFENPKIALLMNERFVCIKVDREERPDVDDIYMAAVQIVTGRGGWPMSVFLTPPGSGDGKDNFRGGLKPFYAGTYFPPEPAHGMPSFPQILLALSNAWNEQPKDVLSQADEVAAGVTKYLGQQDTSGPLNAAVVSTAANQLARGYDPDDGGFGGAAKFPQASNLLFLIAVHQNNPNDELWHALAHTLDRMARGGMYDQVGGGFHRYSTDEKWLVPHFEKMLYDNAQLVEVYLQAQRVRPKPDDADFYSRVARQTCDYVLREMTDSTGAFWSAQDAEVDAHEGQNYVWTADELKQAIGDDKLAELTLVLYGLDRGTNFRDPHDPAAAPINVLYLPEPLDEVARQRKIALADLLSDKAKIDAKLYAARMKRKQPGTDDKVLVSWNGMMIAALAQAGAQLNEPRYTAAAARAADAILSHLRAPDGGLYRSMRGGRVKEPAVNGFLDDYAFFIHGLIELHRATRDAKWLDAARALADLVPRKFGAPMGGYFDTLADQPDLFVRTRGTYDGAIPSGNSRMIHDLLDLSEVTRRPDPMEQGIEDLQSFGGSLKRQGQGMSHMQHALLRAIQIAPERFADATAATQPAATQVSGASPSSPPNRRQALSVSVDRTTIDVSGANNTLIVTLDIGDEYHINASEVKDKSLVPTRLELQGGKGLELQVEYPPGISKKFEFADEVIAVYEGRVMLKTTIKKIGPVAKNAKPVLVLRYQACTERSCLQAKDVELPVIIKGAE